LREAQLQREEALQRLREESSQSTESHAPRHEEPRQEEPRHIPAEEPRHAEPRHEQAHHEERPAPPPARAVDPREELADAGLVMIETDRSKAPAAAPVAEEPQPLGRPRRERPQSGPQDDSLEQVETRK
jgi:hypothetical protein